MLVKEFSKLVTHTIHYRTKEDNFASLVMTIDRWVKKWRGLVAKAAKPLHFSFTCRMCHCDLASGERSNPASDFEINNSKPKR
jgi:hypothetical protein